MVLRTGASGPFWLLHATESVASNARGYWAKGCFLYQAIAPASFCVQAWYQGLSKALALTPTKQTDSQQGQAGRWPRWGFAFIHT